MELINIFLQQVLEVSHAQVLKVWEFSDLSWNRASDQIVV